MHANHREDIDAIGAGDIAAAVGLTDTRTGDTLCDEKTPILLEIDHLPGAGHLAGHRAEDEGRSGQARASRCTRLAQEDPTFRMRTDEETQQTIIAGMGELHLEIILDRLKREFKVEANVGKPQVAYKEAITKTVEQQGRFVRQSGGKGQYGDVWIRLEPLPAGHAATSSSRRSSAARFRGNTSSRSAKGFARRRESGVLAGYPVLDFKATLYDGSYHDVDSSEMAFKIAGSMAFKEANRKAGPILLEPIMKVEVTTPKDYLGAINGDLNRRRGQIQSQEEAPGGAVVITANVPLSEMFGYATDMRSATQGRATYTMEFSRYEKAPKSVEEEIVAKASGRKLTTVVGSLLSLRARRLAEAQSTESNNESNHGQSQIRAVETARQHRHHRSCRPRQDDADGRDHQLPRDRERQHPEAQRRRHRQRARGEGARDYDRDLAPRVRDGEAPLRARRLPRPRRLHQEHDHRRGPDGRRDPRRLGGRRPDAADPRAHPAHEAGRRSVHRRVPEQGRHGRRRGAARARRDGSSRAALVLRVSRRRHSDHPRLGAQGAAVVRQARRRRCRLRSSS